MRLLEAFFSLFNKASAQSLAMRAVYRISVYVQLSEKILQQERWVSLPQGRSATVQASLAYFAGEQLAGLRQG